MWNAKKKPQKHGGGFRGFSGSSRGNLRWGGGTGPSPSPKLRCGLENLNGGCVVKNNESTSTLRHAGRATEPCNLESWSRCRDSLRASASWVVISPSGPLRPCLTPCAVRRVHQWPPRLSVVVLGCRELPQLSDIRRDASRFIPGQSVSYSGPVRTGACVAIG
jgi:hypothetical protein